VSISDCGKWMRGRTIEFSDTTRLRRSQLYNEGDGFFDRNTFGKWLRCSALEFSDTTGGTCAENRQNSQKRQVAMDLKAAG
jgi:hypothetical protein